MNSAGCIWIIINRMVSTSPASQPSGDPLLALPPFLQAKGTVRLDRDARPLLLIEDPETPSASDLCFRRLAPAESVAAAATFPTGELLVPDAGRGRSAGWCEVDGYRWRLGPGGMNAEESRRCFHIRSPLARCWLLVERRKPVINELAQQCGHHFDAEGSR